MSKNETNETESGGSGPHNYITQYTFPLLIVTGVFGNIMILIVIPRIQHLRAFFFYAYARSVSDLAILITIVLPRWIESIVQLRLKVGGHWFCRMQAFVLYFFISVSFWCLAAMAAQRAVVVLWPIRSRAISQVAVAKAVIVAILIYTFLCQLDNILGYPLDTTNCYLGGPISLKTDLIGKIQTWLNFVNCIATVSYTHLTLPTKLSV